MIMIMITIIIIIIIIIIMIIINDNNNLKKMNELRWITIIGSSEGCKLCKEGLHAWVKFSENKADFKDQFTPIQEGITTKRVLQVL